MIEKGKNAIYACNVLGVELTKKPNAVSTELCVGSVRN